MKRFEFSVEVGPMDDATLERVKAAGYAVYSGPRGWRVVSEAPVVGESSVRSQAHVHAKRIIEEFDLERLSDPPALSLRDPDSVVDTLGTGLVLDEIRKSYDPEPKPRPKRKWYQKQMELGLGERKD